jgi:hypothetical protein
MVWALMLRNVRIVLSNPAVLMAEQAEVPRNLRRVRMDGISGLFMAVGREG